MVNIICQSDGHCPYLYYCDSNNHCLHQPVFPLTLYPILVYSLFPFASALCNLSGNSFGEYKVLLLMDMLDYSESSATVLCYPLIVGTALYNFINLILKRHPYKDTSIVDYNIIIIIIPNILYGSTIGALVNKFIPPIIADCLIIVILGCFSVKFFVRYYNFRKVGELKEKQKTMGKDLQIIKPNLSPNNQTLTIKEQLIGGQSSIYAQSLTQKQTCRHLQNFQSQNATSVKKKNVLKSLRQSQMLVLQNPYKQQLQDLLLYESSYHVPQIIVTMLVFVIFQVLSFLAQGKIVFFTMCSNYYIIGMCILTFFYIIYVIAMYFYIKKTIAYYKKIQYSYDYKLDSLKFYVACCLGGFLGGFNGGVFGVGSSTTIIFALLYLDIEPMVASATVGFQVVFSGLGSLCEAFATNEIQLSVAGFFICVTLILGGILSYLASRLVSRLNTNKVNQVLMIIVGSLTGASSVAMAINIALSYINFGSAYMIASSFNC